MSESPTRHRSLRFVGGRTDVLSVTADDLRSSFDPQGFSTQDAVIARRIIASLDESGSLPFEWTPQEDHFLRFCPDRDILGYLVYRYKFKIFPKERIVADFPVYLLIEPISTCNLRCVMCFQVDRSFTRKPFMGAMNYDLFQQVIDEAADNGTRAITLASRGEPTLHPRIGDMLRYAQSKDRFFEIKLNTNGTRLTEAVAHDILSSGVDIVVVSVDATTAEEYEKIRVRGSFSDVVRNIRMLHDIRERHYPQSTTEIRVSGVKILEEQDETAFGAFWSEMADTVAMVRMIPRWDTYSNDPHPELNAPCEYLWERMYVWFDGICNPCDADYKSALQVGKFPDSSLREIWHGSAYETIRSRHLADGRRDIAPCDRCGAGG